MKILVLILTIWLTGCATYSTYTLKRCESQFQCFEVSVKTRIDEAESPSLTLEKTGPDSYKFDFNAESTSNTYSPMEIEMVKSFSKAFEVLINKVD